MKHIHTGENQRTNYLIHLSTIADSKISNPPWVKFQSARWVFIQSATTLFGARAEMPTSTDCMNLIHRARRRGIGVRVRGLANRTP